MMPNTMQWFRWTFLKEVKHLPSAKEEKSYLDAAKRGRHVVPNPHHFPFFCFPCGQYHKDIGDKHDQTIRHLRNEVRWQKEVNGDYSAWEARQRLKKRLRRGKK